jgi:ABC-2 type transport system permease protein
MRRTARIFWIHARVGMLAELQYRTDVWMRLLTSLVLMGASLASIGIVYGQVEEIRGWSSDDLVVVLGVFFLVGAVVNGIVHNSMAQLAKDIKQGTLDFRLRKPVDAQVIAIVPTVDAWRIIDVVLGIGLCAVGMARGGFDVASRDALDLLGGVLLLVGSGCIIAGFWMLITCIAFWTIQGEGILWALDDMYDHVRWPITIFSPGLRLALMTVFPVGIAVTAPAQALTGQLDSDLVFVVLALAVAFLAASRVTWRRAVRRYEGASG